MEYQLPNIQTVSVEGKRVFVRADLDVPLQKEADGSFAVENDLRLLDGLPTLLYLLDSGATVIAGGHLGRPEGIVNSSLSLLPVARWLKDKLQKTSDKQEVKQVKIGVFDGWEITPQFFLLENLRFHKGEEANDTQFAQKLALLADIYVNDAFAASHRNHASIVGVAKLLPSYAGLRLQKEVETLSHVLENPSRPLVVIIGGKKLETKVPLVTKMQAIAEYILVGGKIAQEAKTTLHFSSTQPNSATTIIADLTVDNTSITKESLEKFVEIINLAKTIIWNGPMGLIDTKAHTEGEALTLRLAQKAVESGAYTVVGGGDTTEFLSRIRMLDKFSFVSTGGGAMLAFLSGEKLPGIEVLKNK